MTYYMRKKIANQIIERLGITPNVIRIRIAKMLLMGKPTSWNYAQYKFGSVSDAYDLLHLSNHEINEIKDTIENFLEKMVSQELRKRYSIFFFIWMLGYGTQESYIEIMVKVK